MSSKLLGSGVPTTLSYPGAALAMADAVANAPIVGSWRGTARPVEVALGLRSLSFSNVPNRNRSLFCGTDNVDPENPGFFRLEYGAGGQLRTRYLDMVPGTYYLGVCDNVTITANRWRGATAWGITTTDVQVNAAISEAGSGLYDVMQCTTQSLHLAGGGWGAPLVYAPEGTRSAQVSITTRAPADTLWDGTMPDANLITDLAYYTMSFANPNTRPNVLLPCNVWFWSQAAGVLSYDAEIMTTFYLSA